MKTLTLSEELAQKYCLPCGLDTSQGRMSFHSLALVRKLTREELAPLNKRVRVLSRSLFGADSFETLDGAFRAVDVHPCFGRVGWGRYPGADHWHVTRADGSTVFKTQNYTMLLRWFIRKTA